MECRELHSVTVTCRDCAPSGLAEIQPHEYEPERGNIDDRGPCAICGQYRRTQPHADGEALEAAEREGEEAFMRRNPGVL